MWIVCGMEWVVSGTECGWSWGGVCVVWDGGVDVCVCVCVCVCVWVCVCVCVCVCV